MLGWKSGQLRGVRSPLTGWRQAVAIKPEAWMHGRRYVIRPAKMARIESAEERWRSDSIANIFSERSRVALPLHISSSAGGTPSRSASCGRIQLSSRRSERLRSPSVSLSSPAK